jgi:hypothetical protein
MAHALEQMHAATSPRSQCSLTTAGSRGRITFQKPRYRNGVECTTLLPTDSLLRYSSATAKFSKRSCPPTIAIAVGTLAREGVSPHRLQTATEKGYWYNRERFGIALNEGSYPSIKERGRKAPLWSWKLLSRLPVPGSIQNTDSRRVRSSSSCFLPSQLRAYTLAEFAALSVCTVSTQPALCNRHNAASVDAGLAIPFRAATNSSLARTR